MEKELAALETRMSNGDDEALEEYSHLQEAFAHLGGYDFRTSIKRVLCGLGFPVDEFSLPFQALSGGQRTRLLLALVLLQEADLLLLDEPENHLDLQAREWLEAFLKDWPSAFVIISHDRQMLNAVSRRIVEVRRRGLKNYAGNYDDYVKEKARALEDQGNSFERQQEYIKKEEAWIDRFRYKSTKAKAVQSRIKRLDKLERIQAPESEQDVVKFNLGDVVRSGQLVLDARDMGKSYGRLQLYQDVSFTIERGERVGIIGPNGSGKSTLLKQIAGKLQGGNGTVDMGHKVTVGYYDQQHGELTGNHDVLSEMENAFPGLRREDARKYLGRFLFSGNDVFKSVSTLSGGERSRLALAKLIRSQSNLLLLDEPTNHLDIASRETLEEALLNYPGSILLVSHDRALIDKLVDKLIIIAAGRAEVFLGNYSHYKWKEGEGTRDTEAAKQVMTIRTQSGASKIHSDKDAIRAQQKQKKRFREVEETIADLEDKLKSIDAQFTQLDPTDYEPLSALTSERTQVQDDLNMLFEEWTTLSENTAE